jgi:hypothetical protein
MQLSIVHRIRIGTILPQKGKYTDLILIKSILQKTTLTPQEITEWNIKVAENNTVQWDKDKVQNIEVDFEEAELACIREALQSKNKTNTLELQDMELYEMFNIV